MFYVRDLYPNMAIESTREQTIPEGEEQKVLANVEEGEKAVRPVKNATHIWVWLALFVSIVILSQIGRV